MGRQSIRIPQLSGNVLFPFYGMRYCFLLCKGTEYPRDQRAAPLLFGSDLLQSSPVVLSVPVPDPFAPAESGGERSFLFSGFRLSFHPHVRALVIFNDRYL